MSAADAYDYAYDEPRRHRSSRHRDRRDDREPRYVETQEIYARGAAAAPLSPDGAYGARVGELIRRPERQDSDLSVEEVRREFPPPGAYGSPRYLGRDDRYGPRSRARSAERSSRDDRRSRRSTTYEEKVIEPRRRSLSRNQKILAGVAGAALAVGGKELLDRRKAHGGPVSRNALQTAAIGAAGAFAAYEGAEFVSHRFGKTEEKTKTYIAHQNKNGEVAEYYASSEETDDEKPKKSRRKSIIEGALGLAGLGAAAKAVGDRDGKSRSRRGSPDSDRSRRSARSTRSKSRGREKSPPSGTAKYQQAAKAALIAGATEAFRVRKEPGGWGGAKGKRILTAAIGAGGIDAAADKDPNKHSTRHILEAVVGGLAGNRLINGSRHNVEDEERSRSRRGASRSRSRGPVSSGGGGGAGLAALATAGLGALAGKKAVDHSRERSRERRRDDSYDSRSPSPDRRRKRSKSVSDYARKGLAALGIGEAASGGNDERNRSVVEEETRVRRSYRRRYSSDEDYDDRRDDRRDRRRDASRDAPRDRDVGFAQSRGDPYGGDTRYDDSRSNASGRGSRRDRDIAQNGKKNRRKAEGKDGSGSDSSSDLGSSSGDEKRMKKLRAQRH